MAEKAAKTPSVSEDGKESEKEDLMPDDELNKKLGELNNALASAKNIINTNHASYEKKKKWLSEIERVEGQIVKVKEGNYWNGEFTDEFRKQMDRYVEKWTAFLDAEKTYNDVTYPLGFSSIPERVRATLVDTSEKLLAEDKIELLIKAVRSYDEEEHIYTLFIINARSGATDPQKVVLDRVEKRVYENTQCIVRNNLMLLNENPEKADEYIGNIEKCSDLLRQYKVSIRNNINKHWLSELKRKLEPEWEKIPGEASTNKEILIPVQSTDLDVESVGKIYRVENGNIFYVDPFGAPRIPIVVGSFSETENGTTITFTKPGEYKICAKHHYFDSYGTTMLEKAIKVTGEEGDKKEEELDYIKPPDASEGENTYNDPFLPILAEYKQEQANKEDSVSGT